MSLIKNNEDDQPTHSDEDTKIGTANFHIGNQTTGVTYDSDGETYTGPISWVTDDIILLTGDNLNVSARIPNVFIHSGSGHDAIDVSSSNGNNILDGSTGCNFLTGGSGRDIFFIDHRDAEADIWSTIKGFHAGDDVTVWGLTRQDFNITTLNDQGSPGSTGLTFSITAPDKANANMTLVGYNKSDLSNGKLTVTYGRSPDMLGVPGSDYMLIHAN